MAAPTESQKGSDKDIASFTMNITFGVHARAGTPTQTACSDHTILDIPMDEYKRERILSVGFSALSISQFERSRAAGEHNNKSGFGRLPAEIQNDIFELALVKEDPIIIGANTKLPGILTASSRIRAAAHSMFWERNTFIWQIASYNARNLHKLTSSNLFVSQDTVAQTKTYQVRVLDLPNWDNFQAWLQAEHSATTSETFEIVSVDPSGEFVQVSLLLQATIQQRPFHWRDSRMEFGRVFHRQSLARYNKGWGSFF
ncbi:hypothetical protein TI39_contig4416g00004 [Zymoseptoria brevis]|uniref:F-box domain-containing protein n=1 Tax=Zymoseptoria brevis TaxID=1047168 RepID=A0A0F4G6Z7_9PEZI|nr:hypothetical protein TI39_contig4416g00004 [Zymoseptoria brevis]